MRCFVNVKTKREFEIFYNYCKKNNIRYTSGKLVATSLFSKNKNWLNTGIAFYFVDGNFDYLTYAEIGYGERCGYKRVSFQDIFKENNYLDIE